jgi:hypothetical protein
MARKYTKKNKQYWDSLSEGMSKNSENNSLVRAASFEPALIGEGICESRASISSSSDRTGKRKNQIAVKTATERFANIASGLLPYEYSNDQVGISDAIILCQKAYFNISVFKSTLDLLSEFANSEIYLDPKTGNASSRKFVEAWFKKIKLYDLKEQFFREFYRSGNVFLYKLESALAAKTIRGYGLSQAALNSKVPVRYLVLNPADIVVNGQLTFGTFKYAKILTPFELTRIKKAKTPEEKELYEALPKKTKEQLDKKTEWVSNEKIFIELTPDVLFPVFYKKQDYEPLAVPPGFSVLDDLNRKLELKNVDQAICRSIENVMLLITMGTEPEKGGIDHTSINAMRTLLENKSVGRVLVSDWTTTGEWLIPDLKKVLGKEKYEVLNKDIEQGLGNILLGESKYSDLGSKLKLFFARLEESRRRFLNDFLQKEIDAVCKTVGYVKAPKAKFVKKDVIADETLQKLTTRMMELGILTPEQGLEVIHKGEFPQSEDLKEKQEGYKKDREEGYYLPLVSTNLLIEDPNKQNGQVSTKTASTSAPGGGRPTGTSKASEEKYAIGDLISVFKKIGDLESFAQSLYKEKLGVKSLKKNQKENITEVCKKVVVNDDIQNWEERVKEISSNASTLLKMDIHPEIFSIAVKHGLDDYAASLLYHSNHI